MPRTVVRTALLGALLIPLAGGAAGCNKEKQTPPPPPPPKVGVLKPVVLPVQAYNEYNGTLETTQAVEIRARVKGILTDVHFTEGTEVAGPPLKYRVLGVRFKGQPLYSIEQREFKTAERKAEAELAKATADVNNWTAQIRLAKAEVERLELAGTATSRTELEKARATLEVNEAEKKAAEAARDAADAALHTSRILLGYTDIRAPISGLISRTHVDEGNLVGQTDPTLLTTIVRMDELYVLFDAPERDLIEYQRSLVDQKAPVATDARIPLMVGVTGEEGYPHRGVIDFRENKVDAGTGTIRIRGRLPNPKVGPNQVRILYPGLYARVRVPAGPKVEKPVIPEEALMTGQEGRYVYVVGAENKIAKRTVTVGTQVYRAPPTDPDAPAPAWALKNPVAGGPQPPALRSLVSIEKGLKPEDVIVVDGLQRARPGNPVEPQTLELVPRK